MDKILQLLLSFERENIDLAEVLATGQGIDIVKMLEGVGLHRFGLATAADFMNFELEFNCSGRYIEDLSPLLLIPKLQEIIAGNNKISQLIHLDKFEQLRGINLSRNKLTDISLLNTGYSLEYAHFPHNKISQIPDLSNLKQLRYLGLNDNAIQDISPLRVLSEQLAVLYLENNQIEDISILAEFQELETLYIQNNPITNFSPIANLEKLQTLNIGKTLVDDFSFLLDLKNLKVCFVPQKSFSVDWRRKFKQALPDCKFY